LRNKKLNEDISNRRIRVYGSHTVVELQNEGFEVILIDDLSNTSLKVWMV
jgi:hypothetical protein